MNDKSYTVTMQWPTQYDFPPGTVGHCSPRKPTRKIPCNKAWEKIERLLRKVIEK